MTPLFHRAALLAGGALLVVLASASLLFTHPHLALASGPINLPGHGCPASPSFMNCDAHDPVQEGCVTDATTVNSLPALTRAGTAIGHVDLRFSLQCHSWWVRVISLGGTIPQVTSVFAILPFASGNTQTAGNNIQAADGSLDAYSDMAFELRPAGAQTGGTFDLSDGTDLTITFA